MWGDKPTTRCLQRRRENWPVANQTTREVGYLYMFCGISSPPLPQGISPRFGQLARLGQKSIKMHRIDIIDFI